MGYDPSVYYEGLDFTAQASPPADPKINQVYRSSVDNHLYICVGDANDASAPPYNCFLVRQPLANTPCVAGRFVVPSDNTLNGELRPHFGMP